MTLSPVRPFLLVLLALALPAAAAAQVRFAVRAGAAMPFGDFDRTATTGFAAGVELAGDVEPPGVDVIVSADLLINDYHLDDPLTGAATPSETGVHHSVLLFAGLRWSAAVTDRFGVFLAGQVGPAFHRSPESRWSVVQPNEQGGELFARLAYGVGAGVVFADRFELAVRVYPLGEYDYEPDIQSDADNNTADVAVFTAALGWRL